MEIDAVLADSAAVADGKLYIQGAGWTGVFVPSFPARHDRVGIALVIHVPYTATNQMHSLRIHLEDADGQRVAIGDSPAGDGGDDGKIRQIDGQFNVGRPAFLPPGDEQTVPLAMNIDGLVFEQPGSYRFVIAIDGSEVKALRLSVAQIPGAGIRPSMA